MLGGTVVSANTGTINVEISTAPGEIELDGFPTGQTAPAVIDSVEPGEHLIELEYGCMVGSTTVTVYRDQEATANMRLENRGGEGTVRLRGLPRSAAVFFDDAPLEGIDRGIQVACGGHRVRVEASGFEDWESMVVVTTGRWVTLEVAMVEGQIEAYSPPVAADDREEVAGWSDDDGWDDGDGWDDEGDGWDEPVGPSREDLARAEREARARAAGDRRAAEEADRARREAEAAERRRIEEARRAAEAEVLRLEEEAARARAELELAVYGDIDSLDGPVEAEDEPEERIYEELQPDEIYEEDYDDEFAEDDSWDDDYRGYSDSTDDDLDDDIGGNAIRGGSSGPPVLLAGATTIAGLGGLGFGAYSFAAYEEAAIAWKTVADDFGLTSSEAVSFWSQNVEPKYAIAIVSFVAGGLLTTVGGGLYYFKVMGDDGGGVGLSGEW